MKNLLSIADLEPSDIIAILHKAWKLQDGRLAFDDGYDTQIFRGRHILIVGDIYHSRVARSNLFLITKLGGRVTFVAPPTLVPDISDLPDVKIDYSFDHALSLNDYDAIMLLRIQAERMLGGEIEPTGSKDAGFFPSLEDYVHKFSLTNDRIRHVDPSIPVLHPAPINRGLEISSEIADSARSLINHQIRNGVFVRAAALQLLIAESLVGKTVVNLFFENSTRTRFSFEAAEKKLGANIMNFTASGSSVSKGESLKDTITTLYAMGIDGVVIRHQYSGAAHRLANSGWIDVPVLNAGDGTHAHPTQALLDALTLEQHFAGVSQLHGTTDMYGKFI
jgi:aspartate carbamoyltransferase catalytic subunit